MTATETLLKIIELTNKNLEILGLINESFFTNKEHLTTLIDGTRYTIPSFISLENKVNHLQAAFNNLVHSPMTGEAYMNFDGNSRVIQMRGFQQGPAQVDLDKQYDLASLKQFFTEDSNLFKDMLSPKPYIKLDLSELEDDITQVVVKKIVPYSASLMQLMLDAGASDTISAIDYGVMRALLDSGNIFKKGADYAEYETVYTLPIRKLTCFGEYTVEEIKSDIVDDKLNNIITVQLAEPTVCTIYDGFTTRNLRAGDILTTYDGSARLEIIGLTQSTRTLELKVLSGEYLNILPNTKSVDDKVSDYSKLRFYKPEDFDSDKYLNVPLEEDPYVYITVAPLNSRMNTQANWGTGLYIKVDELTDSEGTPFRDYYKQNVKNIGDTINELASILPAPLTNLDSVEFDALLTAKPHLTNTDDVIDTLQVVQINKHLNEAENIQTIRNLYSQKQQYKVDLDECQNKIATLTAELSEISFDDMSGSRTMISAQIDDLKARQNELIASINTAIDAIALAANDSEVPIEDSKFRIRGYVDIDRFIELNNLEGYEDHVRAVKVRYRYKNPGISELANVSTIGDFLFTEWNNYSAGLRHKTASYNNGVYTTTFDEPEISDNDVKFNQVDIPITQGEQVDIQAKIIWDYGYPFVNIESDWSDAVTVIFPQELAADVQVTTIIRENNDDIETYRFENILNNHGITQHSNDYIDDQNIRYFHKPESISSGFYTEERRVIPLADKLKDMNAQLASIQDMLIGTHAESLQVSLTVNNIEYVLKPDIKNIVHLTAYNAVPIASKMDNEMQTDISRGNADSAATTFGSITIKNITDHTLRLFSMVPGARDQGITTSRRFQRTLNEKWDYAEPVEFETNSSSSNSGRFNAPTRGLSDGNETQQDLIDDGGGGGGGSTGGSSTGHGFVIDTYGNANQIFINRPKGISHTWGVKVYQTLTITGYEFEEDTTDQKLKNNFDVSLIVDGSTYRATVGSGKRATFINSPELITSGTYKISITFNGNFNVSNAHIKFYAITSKDGDEIEVTQEISTSGFAGGNEVVDGSGNTTIPSIYIIEKSVDFGTVNVGQTEEKLITAVCKFPAATINATTSSFGTITTTKTGTNASSFIIENTLPVGPASNTDPVTGRTSIDYLYSTVIFTVKYKPTGAGAGQTANIRFNWRSENLVGDVIPNPNSALITVKGTAIGASGGTTNVVNRTYVIQSAELVNYTGARMVYVMDPHEVDIINGTSDDPEKIKKIFSEQPCNCFTTFRIREPFAGTNMGDQTTVEELVVNEETGASETFERPRGVQSLADQQEIIRIVSHGEKPNESFVYATPTASNTMDLCIQSDAVQSVMEIGPGDSKTIPIFIAYFMKPESPNSAYTIGFDVRNSLYNDPLFYQVTLAARYNQTFEDMLQSQKASVTNQTNYNPVIRS